MKTDNVLLGHDGRVVITDFGIARALKEVDGDGPSQNTGMSVLAGTPAYMAPEQVRGHGRVDTRADLYAVGVMLFQMLTGQLPFSGSSAMATALARLYEAPVDPLKLRPNLQRPLAELLRRALTLNPDGRYQTADELAAALSAERPAGPDLASYLSTRAAIARRALLASGEQQIVQTMSGSTIEAEGTLHSPAQPPLPLLQSEPGSRQLAVTVLLFRFRGDSADEYLANGLTEELIDRLSEAERLLVSSFGVVRGLGPDLRDPATLGQRLNAQVVVDGTLRIMPSGLSAIVRLVEVERGLQYAVRRFERADRNVLALAMEVAKVVGSLLTIKLDQSQGDMVGDGIVVDLYLRARHHYHNLQPEGTAQSVGLFEQALARLPKEPMLLSGYALALARHWFFAGEGAAQSASAAAQQAVHQAPERGESYLALATVQYNGNQLISTARSLRLALARSPRLPEAHELVGLLLAEGGAENLGLRHLNYAMMLDTAVPRVRFAMARASALDGRPEDAHSILDWEGCDPAFSLARWVAVGRLVSWFKDADRARAFLEHPSLAAPEHRLTRRRMAFLAGERMIPLEEYVSFDFQSPAASPRSRLAGLIWAIEYHSICGQFADAVQTLRQVAEFQLADIHWLDGCPLLVPLRETPEFIALRTAAVELAKRVQRAMGIGNE